MNEPLTVLEVRVPRLEQKPKEGDLTPESMEGFLAGLATTYHGSFFDKFFNLIGGHPSHTHHPVALEIAAYDQTIHFYIVVHPEMRAYIESQIVAAYPKALISDAHDYLPTWNATATAVGQLGLTSASYYPLKEWRSFDQTDPLAQVLGVMSKLGPHDKLLVQILVTPAGPAWANQGWKFVQAGVPTGEPGKTKPHPLEKIIKEKLSKTGLKTAIRFLAASESKSRAETLLQQLSGSFSVFSSQDGNSFKLTRPWSWQLSNLTKAIANRTTKNTSNQVLVTSEVASIFHLPGSILAQLQNLAWSRDIYAEPPANLPIAKDLTDDQKGGINFIGRTQYKNSISTFGIKRDDRRRHVYIIGKSGTGKTTLISNMAISDMRNGEGLAVIDPHGDLSEHLLDFVPHERLNDVVYLDPSDLAHPFSLNVLQLTETDAIHKNLVTSGIVAIFNKLYAFSWGPRLEYILRNAIQTLLEVPGATLINLPDLLSNDYYRSKVVDTITDPVMKNFWMFEFNKLDPKTRSEWVSPILNKVGQFVSSTVIRSIIGQQRSNVDFDEIMNKGKILILNLSQGKIGEDNATLLGALFITKMQLAAMNRAHIKEEDRKDFFLYVDEFQNFATDSFAKILSEARKYRLDLTVANQYIGQVPEELQKAIFGNVGTLISFVVGAADAKWLYGEFNEMYKEADLVGLGMYQIVMKETIDGLTSTPFTAYTLPLPQSRNQNREKIIRMSQERFTQKADETPIKTIPTSPPPGEVFIPPGAKPPKRDNRPFTPRPPFPTPTAPSQPIQATGAPQPPTVTQRPITPPPIPRPAGIPMGTATYRNPHHEQGGNRPPLHGGGQHQGPRENPAFHPQGQRPTPTTGPASPPPPEAKPTTQDENPPPKD